MYGNVGCAWAKLGPQGRWDPWDHCPRLGSPELFPPLKPWTWHLGLRDHALRASKHICIQANTINVNIIHTLKNDLFLK